MKVLPLVIHAGIQIPRYTALFSDALVVSSLAVVAGGLVTITCSAAHGVPVGAKIAVSITDALTPNAISAAVVLPNGDVRLTTTFDHDITYQPGESVQWAGGIVNLIGFTSPLLNGNRQLVEVIDRRNFVVKPGGTVATIVLSGSETLLEKLEAEIVGWHSVTAAASTTLTFGTPATVTRSYTAANPVVVRNIRVYGALDLNAAMAQFTENDQAAKIDKAYLFVCPPQVVRASRSQHSGSDLLAENSAGTDYRQLLMDGFEVFAVVPSRWGVAHIEAVDLCHGEIFAAVLKTFYGLKVPRSEFSNAGGYIATFEEHSGGLTGNRAIYVHQYTFSMPAYLTSDDAIAPWDWPNLDDHGLAQGTVPDSIAPVGAPAFRDLDFSNIIHDGYPSPLTGTFKV